jgi:hypothetical protein
MNDSETSEATKLWLYSTVDLLNNTSAFKFLVFSLFKVHDCIQEKENKKSIKFERYFLFIDQKVFQNKSLSL